MNNKVRMNQIFDHLNEKYQQNRMTSENYDLDYHWMLNEIKDYTSQFNNNPDGLFIKCKDFLKEHNEIPDNS